MNGSNTRDNVKKNPNKIPLLEEVFRKFPDSAINLDIKVNNDKLIENVCYSI